MRIARLRLLTVCALFLAAMFPCAHPAVAGVARFSSGRNWGVSPGTPVVWKTGTLNFFTDQGPLSPSVDHASADAMVQAAASVWNVPTSSISLVQGGNLGENVNAGTVQGNGSGVVFPADVQVSNEGNMPVAIIYDEDGSLIDMLMGQGASDPDGCLQSAVVGDIDDVHFNDGSIRHAKLILNGRCAGPDPRALTQMQYQLSRMFGRILGLTWSQNNDNVFTVQRPVSTQQMNFWPVMHPLDLICGNYTFQCMTQPGRLRVDDLNSLTTLYTVNGNQAVNGKQATSNDSVWLWGLVYFPTGQSMGWVNLTTQRQHNGIAEDWQTVSTFAGYNVQQAGATPINPGGASIFGDPNRDLDGLYNARRVPVDGLSNVFLTTEAINPLYTGDAAIGPYMRPPVALSGSPVTVADWSAHPVGDYQNILFLHAASAASSCSAAGDGSEGAPAALNATGWQNGILCGDGHNSWFNAQIEAGHAWSLEVTATDERGNVTINKVQPVLGVWNASDSTGGAPTVASQPVAFNSMSYGVTQLQVPAVSTSRVVRFAVADQFAGGRPDFTYQARMLYVRSVTPAVVGLSGGQITVNGTGFRQGSAVLVNGVPAQVLSYSSTQLIASAPALGDVGAGTDVPLDVQVVDADSNAAASIPAALSYRQLPNIVVLTGAPASVETGIPASTPIVLRVLDSDGTTPIPGAGVTLAVTGGQAQLGVCGGAISCVARTDAKGVLTTSILGEAMGSITITAAEASGGATLQMVFADIDPIRSIAIGSGTHYVAAGASGSWNFAVTALQDGALAGQAPVSWNLGSSILPQTLDAATGDAGTASATVLLNTIAPDSTNQVQVCAWQTVCTTWTAFGVNPAAWSFGSILNGVQSVSLGTALGTVNFGLTDSAGHPLELAPVQVHQRVLAWQAPCDAPGRCPAAPVLAAAESQITSGADGSVSVTPLQLPGTAQVVEIALSAGAQAFATVTLEVRPR